MSRFNDGKPTFWETLAVFVRERGLPSDRKKWTRADELAWGCYYQAREQYWREHRAWTESLEQSEVRTRDAYQRLLDTVGLGSVDRGWLSWCIHRFVDEHERLTVSPDAKPDLSRIAAEHETDFRQRGLLQ